MDFTTSVEKSVSLILEVDLMPSGKSISPNFWLQEVAKVPKRSLSILAVPKFQVGTSRSQRFQLKLCMSKTMAFTNFFSMWPIEACNTRKKVLCFFKLSLRSFSVNGFYHNFLPQASP